MKQFKNKSLIDIAVNVKCNVEYNSVWTDIRHTMFENDIDIYHAILQVCGKMGLAAMPFMKEFNKTYRKCIKWHNQRKAHNYEL